MADYGVTPSGFSLKRLADILADMTAKLSLVTDQQTGESLTPDLLDENDPLVQTVNAFADSMANCWEQLELCYNQFDPLKATGAGLSGLVQLNGILRQPGFPSTVTLTCFGDPGKTVTAGKQVTLMDDSVVFVLPTFTFDNSGYVDVLAICNVDGPNAVPAGQLVKIVTPSAGWKTVTNPAPAIAGQLEETDAELRITQQVSTENTGRGMIDDLFSSIYNLNGVTFCRVYQNASTTTDERSIQGKTVAVIVLGGDPEEIANMIFLHIPLGVLTQGTSSETIVDSQGFGYDMKFSRPEQIDIYVNVVLDPYASNWPSNGDALVAKAILDYSLNYHPGESVYASQLYTAINSVVGAQIVSVEIGVMGDSAAPGQVITIDWNQVAVFLLDNISVTEV